MTVHTKELSSISRYIQLHKDDSLDDKEADFVSIMRTIGRFKSIDKNMRFLEIGTGTGWFPILCKKNGIVCKGLEISQQLVEYSRSFGRRYGIEPDIELGNIEETDIGKSVYDVIVASSVFEHVKNWQTGIGRVFTALKPGGLFYFYSTNKFSFRSGECPNIPFYGWLPNRWRYRLLVSLRGEDIMKLGVDFNQFTYLQLRHFFHELGFSTVLDALDIAYPNNLARSSVWQDVGLRALRKLGPVGHVALLFAPGNWFICIK